ncbi:helix-turn-helix domain-containing protein [Alicyclobacillus macrosporangiidus]|uniref:helix-turn-helix domain-containing protein n=1 Tax=Alicyclobacillus macrosporangiidus TaxID=392015 RepID=UPI0004957BD4|nr:helix-turn-helix domain-containing protein [Alicyclobacillus macrosporangiidus]
MTEEGKVRKGWANEFTQFPNKIYDTQVSGYAKAVYIYLCRRADSEGQSFPGYGTMADEVGFSKSTIRRAVDELIDAGLLTKEMRGRKESGEFYPNLYTVIHPDDARPNVLKGGMFPQSIPHDDGGMLSQNIPSEEGGMFSQNIPMLSQNIRMVCENTELDPLTRSTNEDDDLDHAHARESEFQDMATPRPDTPVDDDRHPIPEAPDTGIVVQASSSPDSVGRVPNDVTPIAWEKEEDPYLAVDYRMMQHLGRPYIARENDYRAIKQLLDSGVPLDFILDGIDYTFATFAHKKIRSFAYCAEVIKQRWACELAKREAAVAIDWSAYRTSNDRRSTKKSGQAMETQEVVRDERYRAFYELFPDLT